jgi:twitching motility protein PilT
MLIRKILQEMVERGASDLHVKVGTPPTLRIDGRLHQMDVPAPSPSDIEEMAGQMMTEEQATRFQTEKEVDFAFGVQGLARFRANLYYQRNTISIALRTVPLEIPRIEELNLPAIVRELSERERGLVLVTGTVGSGKSTTLAAMIDHMNRERPRNIITIEDPIEFTYRDNLSMISQREVALDTQSYAQGLRHILRQDPDVILLGEIRDLETMRIALTAADTGHLVLTTLHTTNAAQTVNRVLSFYPEHQHTEVRFLLASTLAAIISLRLIPRADGQGRVPAVEVLICTEAVKEMILDAAKTMNLPAAIQEGVSTHGMQTFDQSLMDLYTRNLITLEEAVRNASNPSEFQLRIEGIHATSDTSWRSFEHAQPQGAAKRREEAKVAEPAKSGWRKVRNDGDE